MQILAGNVSYDGMTLEEMKELLVRQGEAIQKAGQENKLLNKALEFSCNQLEGVYGTCPFDLGLMDDNSDCENCADKISGCWMKHYLEQAQKEDGDGK